jgi:hypothetical protein
MECDAIDVLIIHCRARTTKEARVTREKSEARAKKECLGVGAMIE